VGLREYRARCLSEEWKLVGEAFAVRGDPLVAVAAL